MLDIFPSTSRDKVSALRFQEQSTLLTRKRKEKIEKRERNYIALVNWLYGCFLLVHTLEKKRLQEIYSMRRV
jgi:hypothetical protein